MRKQEYPESPKAQFQVALKDLVQTNFSYSDNELKTFQH